MPLISFESIKVKGIAACVPKNDIPTDSFETILSSKEKKRFTKVVGIKSRRFVNDDTSSSDLGFEAANKVILDLGLDVNEIKGLIFVSQTSDYKIPFSSNILQDRLGLPTDCLCLDINAGCAGFVSVMATGSSILQSIGSGKLLIVFAETMSKIVSKNDRNTSLIFGDGAAAVVLEYLDNKVKSFYEMYSDGKFANVIKIPHGGSKVPFNDNSLDLMELEDGSSRTMTDLSMDGGAVFDFTLREVPPSLTDFCSKVDDKVSYYIFHQSNKFIIDQFRRLLDLNKEQVPINIDRFGNTSSCSIPLVLVSEKNNVENWNNIICSGYGAGLNWGNAFLDLSDTFISDLIEL